MKNLIVGVSLGYDIKEIFPFISSALCNSISSDILIFSDAKGIKEINTHFGHEKRVTVVNCGARPSVLIGKKIHNKLARNLIKPAIKFNDFLGKTIRPHHVSSEGHQLFSMNLCYSNLAVRRYFWYLKELENASYNQYKYIMLSDIRDVVIQSCPFDQLREPNRAISGQEDKIFQDCPVNTLWMKEAYGDSSPEYCEMMNRPIICSGVTIASRKEMMLYLSHMCGESITVMLNKGTSRLNILDQAIHNKIYRLDDYNYLYTCNYDGIISTLGYVDSRKIKITAGGMISVNENIPCVIHQYDRHQNLTEFVLENYGFNK